MTGCLVMQNEADMEGGGLVHQNEGVLVVNECNITGNSAGIGGGIYNTQSLSVSII
jgi:hypothetical protein